MIIAAITIGLVYLGLMGWGWAHRDRPFWAGFINPFGF